MEILRDRLKFLFLLSLLFLIVACTGVPKGIQPVTGLNADEYLGKWYEIARLDHSFEEGLNRVTAEYELKDDGSIKVTNRGYDAEAGEWSVAEGRAVFVGDDSTGHLKVSFFGPFYASYVIFELDKEEYQYAFVTGYDRDYLWFLSRTPDVSEEAIARFKQVALKAGFDIEELVVVDHSPAK
ncbi:MAG: lipocalin family protein [Oceanospirillales bacterium]|jgi:apolipoprotein D and lipocalin family protein|uniref:lipocalin family protein n=1 Tax=Marinobacter maritimus TaxID=277961 RepID=UPI001642CF2C|nr:lipocalin family protein [Marinobacter maritimus]MBL1273590.1 lipocalin family protein [Oceanospirillales bacterium]|tara:strand:+ start:433 stop:978 length:546 start_codon:yes stop_codon:yes gene_type:complete